MKSHIPYALLVLYTSIFWWLAVTAKPSIIIHRVAYKPSGLDEVYLKSLGFRSHELTCGTNKFLYVTNNITPY